MQQWHYFSRICPWKMGKNGWLLCTILCSRIYRYIRMFYYIVGELVLVQWAHPYPNCWNVWLVHVLQCTKRKSIESVMCIVCNLPFCSHPPTHYIIIHQPKNKDQEHACFNFIKVLVVIAAAICCHCCIGGSCGADGAVLHRLFAWYCI